MHYRKNSVFSYISTIINHNMINNNYHIFLIFFYYLIGLGEQS